MKKINLRESLLNIDRSTDFRHALTDLYEACMLEDGDKKKLAQFIEDKDIPGMSNLLSNAAGVMMENISDDLPDDEVALVENDTMSMYRVANLEDIDYIMSYEMPDCIVYGGDVEGEYKCAYHNGVSVNVKFNPDAPGYVYTIDGEGPYETRSSETVKSDITRALDRKGWNEAFPNGSPIDRMTASGDELDEGIFSIAGDTIRKGMNDFYKGAKSVAGGVKDIAKAGMNDAKNAVTDIKQSKGMAKVRDAARAIKNANNVDEFKADYQRRQDMRKKSDAKRDQVWTDKQGNKRTGRSIGNEQDWTYVVNGKKMKHDDYMKIPSNERQRLNNAGKVKRLDLSGRPITKNQNDKRLNASWIRESILNEGPGAGYEISCSITIDSFDGTPTIKRIEIDRDPGAFANSYKVYLSCNCTGHADDLEAYSYYYGDSFGGTYPVKISELLMSASVVGEGDLREVVNNSLNDILSDLIGFTFTSKYVYGGGWSHSTYDGTLTDTTNPLNDTCWGEDDNISYEVYGMDARLTDSDIIEEIDIAVTGENEDSDFEESLNERDSIIKESYTHFTYKSGANPYIAKTDAEVNKLLKKYGNKVKKVKDGYYEIDDRDSGKDMFAVDDSLTERYAVHPEEDKISKRLMSIPGTTKVEFDWDNAEIYSDPENHLIMLVFCHDGFDEPYFENRRKWRASVLGKLRTMGWTLEDPVEDNDSYLYLVMQKRRAVTENVDNPQSGKTKYKVTWKVINVDDSYVEESKEVLAKDEKSAKATVKDKRARDIKAVKMTEAFKHPQFDGPWWYLCKHGIGPGALPKDVTVLETVEDETSPYRVYVALDKVLTTSELRQYEMKEARPPQKMTESKRPNLKLCLTSENIDSRTVK